MPARSNLQTPSPAPRAPPRPTTPGASTSRANFGCRTATSRHRRNSTSGTSTLESC